jgi:hypothetical protein
MHLMISKTFLKDINILTVFKKKTEETDWKNTWNVRIMRKKTKGSKMNPKAHK